MAYRRSPLMEERLANNRDRILVATRKLVSEGGFREAQIAAVAAVAGVVVSKPMAKKTTFLSGLARAMSKQSAAE